MSGETPRVTIEVNPSELELYERLRRRLTGARNQDVTGPGDILLLLPDLTVLLSRLLRDDRVPRGSKLIALIGVGYVFSPIDLVPAVIFGPLGLVDDLLVVTAALSGLLNRVHPDVVRSHWPGSGAALVAIQRASAWSESVFRDQITGRLTAWLRGRRGGSRRRDPATGP